MKNMIRTIVALVFAMIATAAYGQAAFTLQLLHASDLEGGVDAIGNAPNFAAIVEALEAEYPDNTVILSAGDNYISGPFFNASGDQAAFRDSGFFNAIYNDLFGVDSYDGLREGGGRVDVTIMNVIGFDASAIGNHEFDLGSDALETVIEEDFRDPAGPASDRWVGAQFPYLSANLDFSGDSDLGNLFTSDILQNTAFVTGPAESTAGASSTPKIAPSTFIELTIPGDGESGPTTELIGVIGATTQLLESISSPSGTTVIGGGDEDMAQLASVIQPIIDAHIGLGVNKIILTSHLQQIALEKELATLLSGVDIIVAGGSDTLQADADDVLRQGDSSEEDYPFLTTNLDGDPVAIVSTAGEYSYVGRLVVGFDENGVLLTESIVEAESGAYASITEVVDSLWGEEDPFAAGTKGAVVTSLTDEVATLVNEKDGIIFGYTDVFLEGRREFVRTEETNLGNLTADANLAAAREFDPTVVASLKNGGGIRAQIGDIQGDTGALLPPQANPAAGKPEGAISLLDIENALRFNNGLAIVDLTAQQLKNVLEHAVAGTGPGNTPGQFGQVGGIIFSYDATQQAIEFDADAVDNPDFVVTQGNRIRSAALIDENGVPYELLVENGAVVGDPTRSYRVVTLDFLAVNGGDGYPYNLYDSDIEVIVPREQDALAEYLADNFGSPEEAYAIEETAMTVDARIQSIDVRSDTVTPVGNGELNIRFAGRFDTGVGEGGAEVVAYDASEQLIFVTDSELDQIRIVDFADPTDPVQIGTIDLTLIADYGGVNSVDAKDGLVAVAIEHDDGEENGVVAVYETDGTLIITFEAGNLPDMVTFNHAGTMILVANEGEPQDDVDPEGSITIIDISDGVINGTTATATFTAFNGMEDELRALGVRIFEGVSAAEDLEPEYITISDDDTTAYVSLQEASSLAVVDIASATVTDILPLGFKDHSQPGNELDASNDDEAIFLRNLPVLGMYMPDAIASYTVDGVTYVLTANEGDDRGENEDLDDLVLDPTAFPNVDFLADDDVAGNLGISSVDGDTDGDGDLDVLYSYGARSFSIYNTETGMQVYDSGSDFERITASVLPAFFNSDEGDIDEFDQRSDNKGPEPEAIDVGTIFGQTYAFIGLERVGGIMVYNITEPTAPVFVDYIFDADFNDVAPEIVKFVPAAQSPTGQPYLLASHEVSGTVAIYELDSDRFQLQILHASDLEGGVDAIEDAPNFAAVVAALEHDAETNWGIPSLTLSSGDNYLPGPFFSAAGDGAVRGAIREGTDNPDAREGVGRIDIAIMNAIGFDASAVGNHEFDLGTSTMFDIIGTDIRDSNDDGVLDQARWTGVDFPYLSANLDFSGDGNLSGLFTDEILDAGAFFSPLDDLETAAAAPKIARATTITIGDEVVGIIGATTQILEDITSVGGVEVIDGGENDMQSLADVLQPTINELTALGVNKIILVSHLQQFSLEQELIGLLSGVDVVLAGGSDTISADANDTLRAGDTQGVDYPFVTTNADGDPAAIVSTDGEYSYVGRLIVEFDLDGKLVAESIAPESSTDDNIEGAYATTEDTLIALYGSVEVALADGTVGAVVSGLVDSVVDIVTSKDSNVLGYTNVFLEGRRSFVRTQETNLGNLTADANLAAAQSVDSSVQVSLKNGGGIRAEIGAITSEGQLLAPEANALSGRPEGAVSQLAIENSLRFNNGLTLLTLTAEQLLEVLNHAVAGSAPGNTPGQFGQVGGVQFSFDPSFPVGERVRSAALIDSEGEQTDLIARGGEVFGDPDRAIRVVTLNFLADGGDGYPYDEFIAADPDFADRIDLADAMIDDGASTFASAGSEQDALAEYLIANFPNAGSAFADAETPVVADTRIQILSETEDTIVDPAPTGELRLNFANRFDTGVGEGGAEVVSHDPSTQYVYVTVSGEDDDDNPTGEIRILDFSDPGDIVEIGVIDLNLVAGFGGVNSVAAKNGLVAVAIENADATLNGFVVVYDALGTLIETFTAGNLPDMVTFNKAGDKILVANEGEQLESVNPQGSVSIIDIADGVVGATVTTVDFTAFDADGALDADIRVFPGQIPSEDFEPEYIAVSDDDTTAFVSLQEANAVAVLDIATATFTDIYSLGLKDYSLPGNELDPSDRDDGINIANWPVFGQFMPDAIATYTVGGTRYVVSANEGDARDLAENEERIEDVTLDPVAFPNAAELQTDDAIGRLDISVFDSDTDGDGDMDRLVSYGGRSFSIYDEAGNQVFDSGSDFERITALVIPELFNSDENDPDEFDSRSDAKGPEPEAVAVGKLFGETYAFIGLERVGGIMVYNISDPAEAKFVDYIRMEEDAAPEIVQFISNEDSPNGRAYVIASHEVSGTVAVYEIRPTAFPLQILHASDLEGGVDAIVDAPNFAAIAQALEAEAEEAGIPSLLLSSGDNYLPGPFFSAAGDSSIRSDLRALTGNPQAREGVGRIDIAIMNALGFDASAVGNHEFDLGPSTFADIIGPDIRDSDEDDVLDEARWYGADFPYLSANLDFSTDGDLAGLATTEILPNTDFFSPRDDLEAAADAPKLAPATVINASGEVIGVVGATTQLLADISSEGDVTVLGGGANDMAALAAVLQPVIDDMLAAGVDKIILASHLQQFSLEQELIGLLSGVDIVLAGGSDTRLADDNDVLRPGDEADGDYPFITENADGDPAVVVSTDGEYSYLGRLVVEFDLDGRVLLSSVQPEDDDDENINGAFAAIDSVVSDLYDGNPDDAFVDGTKAATVTGLVDSVTDIVIAKDSVILGYSTVFLEGRRENVRTQETNIGNLSADANLVYAQGYDSSVQVSLKNGGGIRAEIGEIDSDGTLLPPQENPLSGRAEFEVSQLAVENTLRFNNGLSILTLTAEQLVEVMEHAVAATGEGNTPGQFPQVGGMQFSFDPELDAGERVQSLVIVDEDGAITDFVVREGNLLGDPLRPIRIVTLGFLADGGDSYPFDDFATEGGEFQDRVDLEDLTADVGAFSFAAAGTEQDALAEYFASEFGTLATAYDAAEPPVEDDTRIQILTDRADVIFPVKPIARDDFRMTSPGGVVTLNVLDNDEDYNDDDLEIIAFTLPQEGTLVGDRDTGEFTFTASATFAGNAEFFYTITDGNGGFDFGRVQITLAPPFRDWAEQAGVSSALFADSDSDGVTNFGEFIFGEGSFSYPAVEETAEGITLVFKTRAYDSTLFGYEYSTNLTTWTTATEGDEFEIESVTTGNDGFQTVRVKWLDDDASQFVRLKVSAAAAM